MVGGLANAQTGNDDCTTPDLISGAGTFSYDTNGATDSLIPVTCSVSGTFTNLNLDVWFEWTADFTGVCEFSLCAGGGHDSKIAVWPATPGACPVSGTELACDDDFCGSSMGYTSQTAFACTSGTSYLVGIGCYTTQVGAGTFSLIDITPVSCTTPDDTLEENDDCATAVPLPVGVTTGLVVYGAGCTPQDSDFYSLTLPAGQQLDLTASFSHTVGDIDLFLNTVTSCPGVQVAAAQSTTNDEHLAYTNLSGGSLDVVLEVRATGVATGAVPYDLDVYTGAPTLGVLSTVTDPVSGHTYHLLDNSDWSTAEAVATTMGGHLATVEDIAENTFLTSNFSNFGGVTRHLWIGYTDTAVEDTWVWTSGSSSTFTNWWVAGGSPNNSTANDPLGEDFACIYPTGEWEDLHDHASSQWFPTLCGVVEIDMVGTQFCFGDGSDGGSCPCGNMPLVGSGEGCVNGSGLGAYLTASGTPSVAADTLVLTVSQAVPSDFGIFVQNISLSAAPAPFYNGLFCLAANSHLVRHYAPPAVQPTVTDATGMGANAQSMTVGDYLNDTQPGVTVYYQFWGRDNIGPCGTGANFSSGLAIDWTL